MRALLKDIEAVPALTRFGRVARIEGLLVEVTGAAGAVSLGGQVRLTSSNGKKIPCEVVGFRDGRALVMPLGSLDGVSLGARADFDDRPALIYPVPGLARPRARRLRQSRWTARVRWPQGPIGLSPQGRAALGPLRGRASAASSIWASRRSMPSPPAARASAWAFSRAPAWANRPCWPCWRAIPTPTPS